ncbi:hypothetical protein WR25_24819 isoform B [Diploscapter pachys]|uniref:CBM21 domain-containing protein n=2 Tax=Diploscapter pachys TaxID=2018661 RepID=A0A2A2LPY5_9BILA|nr:hypothetical protein WR25_24819 isoform B [Diploscapter pachys]
MVNNSMAIVARPSGWREMRRKLEIIQVVEENENNELSSPSSSQAAISEPPATPDSGFSSDDGNVEPLMERCRLDRDRAKTLPSALRRSRSKQVQKRVRFADSLGLDLEKREYFVKDDVHFSFLSEYSTSNSSLSTSPSTMSIPRLLLTNFVYLPENDYQEKVRNNKVSVVALRASGNSVLGQINVLDVAFEKKVHVRYTIDDWASHAEVPAFYSHRVYGTSDIDAFNFSLDVPASAQSGNCEFCVQYVVNDTEFWDNNEGTNHKIQILSDESKKTTTNDADKETTAPSTSNNIATSPQPQVG